VGNGRGGGRGKRAFRGEGWVGGSGRMVRKLPEQQEGEAKRG